MTNLNPSLSNSIDQLLANHNTNHFLYHEIFQHYKNQTNPSDFATKNFLLFCLNKYSEMEMQQNYLLQNNQILQDYSMNGFLHFEIEFARQRLRILNEIAERMELTQTGFDRRYSSDMSGSINSGRSFNNSNKQSNSMGSNGSYHSSGQNQNLASNQNFGQSIIQNKSDSLNSHQYKYENNFFQSQNTKNNFELRPQIASHNPTLTRNLFLENQQKVNNNIQNDNNNFRSPNSNNSTHRKDREQSIFTSDSSSHNSNSINSDDGSDFPSHSLDIAATHEDFDLQFSIQNSQNNKIHQKVHYSTIDNFNFSNKTNANNIPHDFSKRRVRSLESQKNLQANKEVQFQIYRQNFLENHRFVEIENLLEYKRKTSTLRPRKAIPFKGRGFVLSFFLHVLIKFLLVGISNIFCCVKKILTG